MTAAAVYRLFSATGELLYVGATKNVPLRMSQHRADKPWWGDVDPDRTKIAWFDSVDDAARAEFDAIQAEVPRYNVASTGSRKPQMYRVPSGRRGPCADRKRTVGGESSAEMLELNAAQAELESLEADLRAEREARNHALRAALQAGVTWKRAGEVTGLSPRGIQISIREE